MNVLDLPFNHFVGLMDAEDDDYLLKLPESDNFMNHLKTLHASALFALAEASSGKFLLKDFADLEFPIIPMLREASVKYSKPVKGSIRSKARLAGKTKEMVIVELENKSRTLIDVEVILYSEEEERVMRSVFQWFVTKL
jgi:acyl-coenzyme A thioesterase PaaI-like protein